MIAILATGARVLNIVPGWVWAGLLASALVMNCNSARQRDDALMDLAQLRATTSEQKTADAKALTAATKKTLDQERLLGALRQTQEVKDASNEKIRSKLADDLRRLSRAGGGPGLRDPRAHPAPAAGVPAGPASAAPGSRTEDRAEAAGLLQPELEGLLLRLVGEADEINDSYASCKADAANVRKRAGDLLPGI